MRKQVVLVLLGLIGGNIAWSQAGLEPHVHGEANLRIVLEQDVVLLELESPAMNLVGFEHEIRTEEEHERVEVTLSRLRSPDTLFQWSAEAQCVWKESVVATTLSGEQATEEHHAEHEDHAVHQEKAGADHHENHAEHGGGEMHAEFTAQYSVVCRNPGALKAFDAKLFELYPGVEEIEVQWVGLLGQGKASLSAKNPTVRFP